MGRGQVHIGKTNGCPSEQGLGAVYQESPLSIECKVVQAVEVGDHVWFIGEVLETHVREGYDWKEGLLLKWVGEEGVYCEVGKKVEKYQSFILRPFSYQLFQSLETTCRAIAESKWSILSSFLILRSYRSILTWHTRRTRFGAVWMRKGVGNESHEVSLEGEGFRI